MALHKIFYLIPAMILLSLAARATAGGLQPTAMVFTQADNGKQITLSAGQTFEVRLQQAGGTGYMWRIVNLDVTHLKVASSGTTPFKSGPTAGGAPIAGGPVEMTWKIEAVKAGKTDLSVLLYRSWEGVRKAAKSFKLTIDIK